MSKLTFVLVVLLFGSSAFADNDRRESSRYANNAQHSQASDDAQSVKERRRGHHRRSNRHRERQTSFDEQSYSEYRNNRRSSRRSHRRGHATPVCDVVRGGTRGLHRLCVAYCQADDVDALFTKYEFRPHRARMAGMDKQALLDRYNEKKRASDPAMPCIEVPPVVPEVVVPVATCPCWGADTLDTGHWQGRSAAAQCLNAASSDELEAGASGADFARILALNVSTEVNYCVRVDEQSSLEMMEVISETDVATCRAQVRTTCEALAG